MNENENVTNAQGSELSKSNKELADLTKKQSEQKRRTGQEMLKKYFVPRNNKELFRILPPKTGKKVIEEAFFHVVTTNVAGKKLKHGTIIYCPAHNDPRVKKADKNGQVVLDDKNLPVMIPAPCPLCKKSKDLLETQDPSVKGVSKEKSLTLSAADKVIYEKNKKIFLESNSWQAKKFYIVRGIDKGVPRDGVKFWRFKHSFQNTGTLNTLLPALYDFNAINQTDYTNVQNGTDLSISTVETTSNNGIKYRAIVGISARGKSPLSDDIVVIRDWLSDDITWREVFQPKKAPNITAYQFLEMIVAGINPYWDDTDSNNKRWVFPNNPELETLANTRTRNLDADNNEGFEYASDVVDEEYSYVPVTVSQVNTPISNVETSVIPSTENADLHVIETEEDQEKTGNEYDDLPF
jgi:glutaredoxin